MDKLDDTKWDVVIAGTGIQESLLALALSRSGLKILHVDKNDYYGASVAALSLEEAEQWAEKVNEDDAYHSPFSSASTITKPDPTSLSSLSTVALGPSRLYSISLSPTIIPTRSSLLSSVVSARVDQQLDFLAHGSTWLLSRPSSQHLHDASSPSVDASSVSPEHVLSRVPNSREDIFKDNADFKSRRSVIKFLRFVGDVDGEGQRDIWRSQEQQPFSQFLQEKFALTAELQKPIHALTVCLDAHSRTKTEWALRRIERHMKSMGLLGPGFGAVLPKWGGSAELVQAGCRAQAVGGGVYSLGQGIVGLRQVAEDEKHTIEVELKSGEKVKSQWLAAGLDNIPRSMLSSVDRGPVSVHSVSVVSSPLTSLFAKASDESPEPAGALISVCDDDTVAPVHIIAHSSDTGDCPTGQCVLYATTQRPSGFDTLLQAVNAVLNSIDRDAHVLWRLQYERCAIVSPVSSLTNSIIFPEPPIDLVFDDGILDSVKVAWKKILGLENGEGEFLKFPPREGEEAVEDEVG